MRVREMTSSRPEAWARRGRCGEVLGHLAMPLAGSLGGFGMQVLLSTRPARPGE